MSYEVYCTIERKEMKSILKENAVIKVLSKVFGKGELFLVGGAVRDIVICTCTTEIKDYDFTTPLTVEQIKHRLAQHSLPTIPLGEEFGTVGTIIAGEDVQITMFRQEDYEEGSRFPQVEPIDDLVEDLARRDFRMNAMAVDIHTFELIDPFDGKQDIADEIIRCVGVPTDRFKEDPLRMLRAYRFSFQKRFDIDPTVKIAIQKKARSIFTISAERQKMELDKILLNTDDYESGLALDEFFLPGNIGALIVPEVAALSHVVQPGPYHENSTVLEHTVKVVSYARGIDHKWAALLHDIGKPATYTVVPSDGDGFISHFYGHDKVGAMLVDGVCDRLKFSNESRARVRTMVGGHMQVAPMVRDSISKKTLRRFVDRNAPYHHDLIDLAECDIASHAHFKEEDLDAVVGLHRAVDDACVEEGKAYVLPPMLGDTIMAFYSIPEGPEVGRYIKLIVEGLLNDELHQLPTLEECIQYLTEEKAIV